MWLTSTPVLPGRWWNLCTWALVTASLSGKNNKEEESIFNYRLSRARRVIENCLGILVARWRVFCRAIQAKIETVQAIVQTAICLHNYLRQTDTASYCPAGFVDQSMIQEIFSSRVAQNHCSWWRFQCSSQPTCCERNQITQLCFGWQGGFESLC